MKELEILEDAKVLIDAKSEILKKQIKEDSIVIYFCEELLENDDMLRLCNEEKVQNFIVFSKIHNHIKNKKIYNKNVNKIKKNKNQNVIIILNINDNYEYMKFVIKNAQKVVEMCKKNGKKIQIVEILNQNSKYYTETVNCIKAMFIEDDYERYAFIYDIMCDILDAEFSKHNYCQFKNDRCRCNEHKEPPYDIMGCCRSFEYNSLFHLRPIRNEKQCALLQDHHCSTRNLSCKLFTCKDLKNENIVFSLHDYLLLECFFNRKQKDVIEVAYFVKREDILEKLIEVKKDKSSYLSYFIHFKYRINKRY